MGLAEGLVYYLLYVVIIPMVFQYSGLPTLPIEQYKLLVFLAIFIALGIAASLTNPSIGVVFEALTALIGLQVLVSVVGVGVVKAPIQVHGALFDVMFEFKPIAVLVFGFIALFTLLRMFEKIIHFEE